VNESQLNRLSLLTPQIERTERERERESVRETREREKVIETVELRLLLLLDGVRSNQMLLDATRYRLLLSSKT